MHLQPLLVLRLHHVLQLRLLRLRLRHAAAAEPDAAAHAHVADAAHVAYGADVHAAGGSLLALGILQNVSTDLATVIFIRIVR